MELVTVIFALALAINFGNEVVTGQQRPRQLKLLHFIFRHGIRTPTSTYPKDPYINATFYPDGWGQVTRKGKLNLYNHGKYLRLRYGSFLGEHYSPDIYYVQTTDVDRTKVTAQCINAGLWEPDQDQKWGPLNWNPIAAHSEPLDEDNLLLVRRQCPQYSIEQERVLKSPEIQRKLANHAQIFRELEYYTGQSIKEFEDAQDIYTTFMAEEAFDLNLPPWASRFYPGPLYDATTLSFILNAYNTKMNRLKGGVLLKKLISDWENAARGTLKPKQRKAFLYIGHDSTIVNLLSALQIWEPQIPGFAINVIIEFSKDTYTNQYGVQIMLRNSTDGRPHVLQIPNCDKFCPLDRLIQLTRPVVPDDWEEECKTDDPNYIPKPPGAP